MSNRTLTRPCDDPNLVPECWLREGAADVIPLRPRAAGDKFPLRGGTLEARAFQTGRGGDTLHVGGAGSDNPAEGWPGNLSIFADLTDPGERASLRAFAETILRAVADAEGAR